MFVCVLCALQTALDIAKGRGEDAVVAFLTEFMSGAAAKEEEAAKKKKAEEEAAAKKKKKAEEEEVAKAAAKKKKAEEEAVAKKKAEEEAAAKKQTAKQAAPSWLRFLQVAAEHVHKEYLVKDFKQKLGLADESPLQCGASAVPRPNHGLCHAIRQAHSIPLVADYLCAHPPQGRQSSDFEFPPAQLRGMQLTCLFMPVGRENEAGTPDEDKNINRFWLASARALTHFLALHPWLDQKDFAIPSELHSGQNIWFDPKK